MEDYRVRVRIFTGIILVVLLIFGGRLFSMQILNNEEYTGTSRSTAVREMRVIPSRGAIFDRSGNLLVDNEATYSITIKPYLFDTSRVDLLASLMNVPDSTVTARLQQARQWSLYRPSPIFEDVPFKVFSKVLEKLYLMPGVSYEVSQTRSYMTNATAAHALGYVREVTGAELKARQGRGYRMGDQIGKIGLENTYEPLLRGRVGSEFRMVNIHGLDVKSYRGGRMDVGAQSGLNLHLSLDAGVQALAESLFVNKRGGAVAMDPNTGEIISIVSKPDFRPQAFSGKISPEYWQYLTQSEYNPMYNRATQMAKPPGSAWKPFMAALGLATGAITPESTINCPGYHPIGGGVAFTCLHVHGNISVRRAIAASCNTFFFEVFTRVNIDTFKQYANAFGFGERLRTDIAEQDPGLIPDSSYFNRLVGEGNWGIGWTLSLGIGQGNMLTTPLQLAQYMSITANKGTRYPPHMVRKLVNPETGEEFYPSMPVPEEVPIDEEVFDVVREGMKMMMEEGTGYWLQIPGIPSGAKTGTAQNPHGKDHSVFVMFAPVEDPEIAIGVIVENAGYGSTAAGPIASLMAEKFIRGELSDSPETQRRIQMAMSASSEGYRTDNTVLPASQ